MLVIAGALVVAFLIGAEATASSVVRCGGGKTLEASGHTRVFVAGGRAYGCVRASPKPFSLGRAAIIRKVRIAGSFAVVVRGSGAEGKQLALYDLKRRRRVHRVDSGADRINPASFTAVDVAANGNVAYVLSRESRQGVSIDGFDSTGEDLLIDGSSTADPNSIWVAGNTVAWRERDAIHLVQAGLNATGARPEVLLREGPVTFEIRDRKGDVVTARYGGNRPTVIGDSAYACVTAGGCSGVDQLRVAGRYVASRHFEISIGDSVGSIQVNDLVRRTTRTACWTLVGQTGTQLFPESFVVTGAGRVSCGATIQNSRRPTGESVVLRESTILDRGASVDAESLARDGSTLTWLNGDAHRTAPLTAVR